MHLPLRPLLSAALAVALAMPLAGCAATPEGEAGITLAAGASYRHELWETTSDAEFDAAERHRGTDAVGGTLQMTTPIARISYAGLQYDQSYWMSDWQAPTIGGFSQAIPSWDIAAPAGTWVRVRVRARTATGQTTGWKNMAWWGWHDIAALHSSGPAQEDALSRVATDTLVAKPGVTFTALQWDLELYRRAGTTLTPRIESVHAVFSQIPSTMPPTSTPLLTNMLVPLPSYSQMIHSGHYPRYGGGGEAWCSPTALSMVLGHYGAGPRPAEFAWVGSGHREAWVDEVARKVYDYGYRGAGNWAFNTAYAAQMLPTAMVTRLASLQDAERFIRARIPLIVSVAFGSGQLTGAPISATDGHLLVIVGFTTKGEVVVHDPAAPSSTSVRRIYNRAQFEAAWRRGSHGLTYLVKDDTRTWPAGYVK